MPLYPLTSILMNFWNIEHYGASIGDGFVELIQTYGLSKNTTNILINNKKITHTHPKWH